MDEPRDPILFKGYSTKKYLTRVSVFLSMARTLEGLNPETRIFFKRVEHQKIFDMCLGIFQNLDQGPDGALKTVIL